MNETQPLELKFGRFEPVKMVLPINWAMDPFDNRQWKHNFMTLRWLPVKDPAAAVSIV